MDTWTSEIETVISARRSENRVSKLGHWTWTRPKKLGHRNFNSPASY